MDNFWFAFWTALFAALPPFLMALATFIQQIMNGMKRTAEAKAQAAKIDDVHDKINGRMDQIVALTKSASNAEGVLQGVQQEKERVADSKPKV